MPLFHYLCECGVVTEALQGRDVEAIPCRACGQTAKRQAVYRVSFSSSGLPTGAGLQSGRRESRQRFADYREASQELAYAHAERENDAGHSIQEPNYYEIGKARAAQLRKAGVKNMKEVRR